VRGAVSSSCLKLVALAVLNSACGATVDPLGYEPRPPDVESAPDSDTLRPLAGPASYPNPFRELLGKSDAEVSAQVEAAFQRLFHGDPTAQAIYFTVGDDQAYIQDILHGDVRSEGMGLGMLIAVQLDHREEFDRLWRFAHASLEYDSGPARGYFRSTCSSGPCIDPYGHQELAMALLFAHGRWGSRSGGIDYGSEALRLLEVMWQTPPAADSELTALFDAERLLVVDEPTRERADVTRPSNIKPGYYALWALATGDDRFSEAAQAGRAFLQAAAHPRTGLLPLRADFDGVPVPGSDNFMPEGYRAQLNMALDFIWRDEGWYVTESDRLLGFFVAQGLPSYGSSYPLDGSRCIDCFPSTALVAMNGVSALAATHAERAAFVEAAWDAEPQDGDARYYDGLLHLLSLLALSGNFRVY
jgi:oligosaccharide reducing-end xylanase